MITFYAPNRPAAVLEKISDCPALTRDAVFIDLLEPTTEEELALEAALGVDIPTREEMQAIELSSRLYEDNGTVYMTATVLSRAETARPQSSPVTFILGQQRLITLRYADPVPFSAFKRRREANLDSFQRPGQFLGGVVDAIVERVADILEGVGLELDRISTRVFEPDDLAGPMRLSSRLTNSPHGSARKARQRNYASVLREIGIVSDRVSRVRESLLSFTRLVAFFREGRKAEGITPESQAHFQTISGDLSALSDHATFLSGKLSFLLDATLGMISNEQNAIIKILSVAALVFLPPTLVAGIYGMNFKILPELDWRLGYPWALSLMVLSAVLPYFWFKRKGWL